MARPLPIPKASVPPIDRAAPTQSTRPPLPPRPPIDAWVPYVNDDGDYYDSSRTATPIGRRPGDFAGENSGNTNARQTNEFITGSSAFPNPYDDAYNVNGNGYGQSDQLLTAEPYTPVWSTSASALYPSFAHGFASPYDTYTNKPPPSPSPPPVPPKSPRRPASADNSRPIQFPEAQLPSFNRHQNEPHRGVGSSRTDYSEFPANPMSYEESQNVARFGADIHGRKSTLDDYPEAALNATQHADLHRGPSRYDFDGASYHLPEPQMHRSVSHQDLQRPPAQRTSHSDEFPLFTAGMLQGAPLSRADSYASVVTTGSMNEATEDLAPLSLETEEGLRDAIERFQAGKLPPADDEWHRLVTEGFRETLDKDVVQRQSIIFEILKSERDYVADMQAVNDVYIQPLRQSRIIPPDQVEEFIHETFFNLNDILSYHRRMLEELFTLQLLQHPLIMSISRIVLENALKFIPAYETYIKHSPLAEARHRTEMKRNPQYEAFVKSVNDPRIKKREVVSFILRPVRKLPQLRLQLEGVMKRTPKDSEDIDDLQTIISVLGDCVKASQPGIQAAESKVKFWSFMENLVFTRDEVIDLNAYDDSRSLEYEGTLSRRQRSEFDWSGWYDYHVVLLDHYLIITRKEERPNLTFKFIVTSRPIPLAYLGLDQFNAPPENRKMKPEDGGSILDSLRFSNTVPAYPFTLYHADSKEERSYTFYAPSEAARSKWYQAFVNTIGLYNARMEANKWFAESVINDSAFRTRTPKVPISSSRIFTGRITAAASFTSAGKSFIAVGTLSGIYLGIRGQPTYRKVLDHMCPTALVALQDYNKFLVHIHEQGVLYSYSLDMLARVSTGQSQPQALDATLERVSGSDKVVFFRAGVVNNRTVVLYATTRRLSSKTTFHVLEPIKDISTRRPSGSLLNFHRVSDSFYIPADAFGASFLNRTIAIAMDKAVAVVNPLSPGDSMAVVPDFSAAAADPRVASLKEKCEDARALGIVRVNEDEIMVVYQDFGCYVTRHGLPRRNSTHVRWEGRAIDYVHRDEHVLLFSSQFIEIRHVRTGRLIQVILGRDIRLLNAGILPNTALLVAKKGKKNDYDGQSDAIFELLKTTELPLTSPGDSPTTREDLFDGWDL